jgi:hypothetical protein
METFAIVLQPGRRLVERHLRRFEAETYVAAFNRLMQHDGIRAELLPEPADDTPTASRDLPRGDRNRYNADA